MDIDHLLKNNRLEDLKLAKNFLNEGKNFLIVTHNDVDGIASCFFLRRIMRALGKSFFFLRIGMMDPSSIKRIKQKVREFDSVIFCDIGSSFLSGCKDCVGDRKTLIMDHHEIIGDFPESIHINPLRYGEDGIQNCCGTVLAYTLLCYLRPSETTKNIDILFAGIIGDKQDVSPTFFNRGLIAALVENRAISKCEGILGTNFQLKEYFQNMSSPYLKRMQERAFMSKCLNIVTPDDPSGKRRVSDLSEKELKEARKIIDEQIELLPSFSKKMYSRTRYMREKGGGRIFFDDTYELFDCFQDGGEVDLDRCDPFQAENYRRIRQKWVRRAFSLRSFISSLRTSVKGGVLFLHSNPKGMVTFLFETYFYYINPFSKDIAFLLRQGENHVKVSSRTVLERVVDGLNLAGLMESLAKKFGGNGGGHRIAAGGRIENTTVKQVEVAICSILGLK